MTMILIATKHGRRPLDAELVVPGLAIHPGVGENGPMTMSWVVTHTPTGRTIGKARFRSSEQARELARDLAALGDWNTAILPDELIQRAGVVLATEQERLVA